MFHHKNRTVTKTKCYLMETLTSRSGQFRWLNIYLYFSEVLGYLTFWNSGIPNIYQRCLPTCSLILPYAHFLFPLQCLEPMWGRILIPNRLIYGEGDLMAENINLWYRLTRLKARPFPLLYMWPSYLVIQPPFPPSFTTVTGVFSFYSYVKMLWINTCTGRNRMIYQCQYVLFSKDDKYLEG